MAEETEKQKATEKDKETGTSTISKKDDLTESDLEVVAGGRACGCELITNTYEPE